MKISHIVLIPLVLVASFCFGQAQGGLSLLTGTGRPTSVCSGTNVHQAWQDTSDATNYQTCGIDGLWHKTQPISQGGTGASDAVQALVNLGVTGNAVMVNGASVPASATVLGSNSSSQLTSLVTTGTGSAVLATSPSLITPTLGAGNATSVTITGTPPSVATTAGLINLGTQNYSDTGMIESFQYSVNGYIYNLIENTSTGTGASACYLMGNSATTSATNYGELCLNGTGYTGSGEYNAPSATLLDSLGGDLGIGTATANDIHFFVNAGASDSARVNGTSGTWMFNSPAYLANGSQLLGTTATSITGTLFTTTGIIFPATGVTYAATYRGRCHVVWQQSTAVATVQFGIGTSVAPAHMSLSAVSFPGTTAVPFGTGATDITTATTTAATAAITPGATGTNYITDIDVVASFTAVANTVTLYGLTSSASDALLIEPGTTCMWLP